ncbi:unnamed protein product [Choristocarpus tenellus]
MGILGEIDRQYYHYKISTGTYAFYPAERVLVNAMVVTLFVLTSYFSFRGLRFGYTCLEGLITA